MTRPEDTRQRHFDLLKRLVTRNTILTIENRGSSQLRISEFFWFQWQNLTTEILRLLQSENEAVILITSPLYNICLQQM